MKKSRSDLPKLLNPKSIQILGDLYNGPIKGVKSYLKEKNISSGDFYYYCDIFSEYGLVKKEKIEVLDSIEKGKRRIVEQYAITEKGKKFFPLAVEIYHLLGEI
jgi:hypothetical protein